MGLEFIDALDSIVVIIVGQYVLTGDAPAILGALDPREKALAVHLHALGFFAVTSFLVLVLRLLLRIDRRLLRPRFRLLLLEYLGLWQYLVVGLPRIQIHFTRKFKFCF